MNTIKRKSGQETQGASEPSAHHPLDWQTGGKTQLRIPVPEITLPEIISGFRKG